MNTFEVSIVSEVHIRYIFEAKDLPEAEKISEKYCNDNECKIQLLTELNDSEVQPEVTEIIEYENVS
jgi:hypothetical protein